MNNIIIFLIAGILLLVASYLLLLPSDTQEKTSPHTQSPNQPTMQEHNNPSRNHSTDDSNHTNIPYTYAVIPAQDALGEEEVAQIFEAVSQAHTAYNAGVSQAKQAKALDEYAYQLVVQDSADTRSVLIQGMPLDVAQTNPDWHTTQLFTLGGGIDYLSATYDPQSGIVSDFSTHGES
jgi:hypothetical protein